MNGESCSKKIMSCKGCGVVGVPLYVLLMDDVGYYFCSFCHQNEYKKYRRGCDCLELIDYSLNSRMGLLEFSK